MKSSSKRLFLSVWPFALYLLALLAPQSALADSRSDSPVTKQMVAVSMREAKRVRERLGLAELSVIQSQIEYLGGITWPWAVVFDPEGHDWILVGERDPNHSVLSLDDWISAVRARFLFPALDPGVTLLPPPNECDHANFSKCLYRPHRVEFFAGIENTDFGATCLAADVLLKRIVLGLESPPSGVQFTSLPVLQAQYGPSKYALLFNRFWIFPLVSEVNVADNVALLEHFRLGVLTEVMSARDWNGREIGASLLTDPASIDVAKMLSDAFIPLAGKWQELDRLQGLGRLASLAKGLQEMPLSEEIYSLLSTVQPRRVETSKEISIYRVSIGKGFEIVGGVQMHALLSRLNQGDMAAFRELVTLSRPSKEAALWEFTATIRNGRFEAVRYASPGMDTAKAGSILQQARLLAEKGYYQGSLRLLDEVVREFPRHEAARLGRSVALFRSGEKGAALREASLAVSISGSERALLLRASMLAMDGQLRASLEDLDRAIETNPAPMSLFMRSMVYLLRAESRNNKPERAKALVDLNRILKIIPEDSVATLYRGFIYLSDAIDSERSVGAQRAVEDFSKVIGVGALRPRALLGRGIALVLEKRYREAISDLDVAIEIFPDDSLARLARAEARQALKEYVGAAIDRRKAAEGRAVILNVGEDELLALVERW